jgi:hypothetical protein
VAIGRAVVSRCVLRESPADFLADAFDLLCGVLTEGYIASVRDVEAKSANYDERDGHTSHDGLQQGVSPLKEGLQHTPFWNVPFGGRRHPMSAIGVKRRTAKCPLLAQSGHREAFRKGLLGATISVGKFDAAAVRIYPRRTEALAA